MSAGAETRQSTDAERLKQIEANEEEIQGLQDKYVGRNGNSPTIVEVPPRDMMADREKAVKAGILQEATDDQGNVIGYVAAMAEGAALQQAMERAANSYIAANADTYRGEAGQGKVRVPNGAYDKMSSEGILADATARVMNGRTEGLFVTEPHQPDGLFAGNRVRGVTSEAEKMQEELRQVVKDEIGKTYAAQIHAEAEVTVQGGATEIAPDRMVLFIREAIARGEIDAVQGPGTPAQRGNNRQGQNQSGKPAQPGRMEIVGSANPAVQELSKVYATQVNEYIARIEPVRQEEFQRALRAALTDVDTLRKHGKEAQERGTARTRMLEEARAKLSQQHFADSEVRKRAETQRATREAQETPDATGFGLNQKNERTVVVDAAEAYDMAHAEDTEATAGGETYKRYQRLIDSQQDRTIRARMQERQARRAGEAQKVQRARNEAHADILLDSHEMSQQVLERAGRHQPSVEELRVSQSNPDIEEQAQMRREALTPDGRGLGMPFMEEKRGGWHRVRSRKFGPRVVDSYYRIPGQDHLVVMERRARRSGELLSQSIYTTEKPIRDRPTGSTPPREIRRLTDQSWQADKQMMIDRSGAPGGSTDRADFYGSGRTMGDAIDGDNGVYVQNETHRILIANQTAIPEREQENQARIARGEIPLPPVQPISEQDARGIALHRVGELRGASQRRRRGGFIRMMTGGW